MSYDEALRKENEVLKSQLNAKELQANTLEASKKEVASRGATTSMSMLLESLVDLAKLGFLEVKEEEILVEGEGSISTQEEEARPMDDLSQ